MCLHIAEFPSWWHICDFDIIRLNVGYVVRILQSLFWRVGHHRSVAFVCFVVCTQDNCILKTDSVNRALIVVCDVVCTQQNLFPEDRLSDFDMAGSRYCGAVVLYLFAM